MLRGSDIAVCRWKCWNNSAAVRLFLIGRLVDSKHTHTALKPMDRVESELGAHMEQ